MDINFICQREQSIFADDSCHIACLLMLLKHVDFSPLPSYEDLCEVFNLSDPKNLLPEIAIPDLLKFIVRNNLNFRTAFRKENWKETLKIAPVMAAMYGGTRFWGQGGHMIILTQFQDETFTYLDPWFSASTNRHIKTISKKEFYTYYGGFSCQLLPYTESVDSGSPEAQKTGAIV
jgi:hypothetical protein